jgi:hypothetical protein
MDGGEQDTFTFLGQNKGIWDTHFCFRSLSIIDSIQRITSCYVTTSLSFKIDMLRRELSRVVQLHCITRLPLDLHHLSSDSQYVEEEEKLAYLRRHNVLVIRVTQQSTTSSARAPKSTTSPANPLSSPHSAPEQSFLPYGDISETVTLGPTICPVTPRHISLSFRFPEEGKEDENMGPGRERMR